MLIKSKEIYYQTILTASNNMKNNQKTINKLLGKTISYFLNKPTDKLKFKNGNKLKYFD